MPIENLLNATAYLSIVAKAGLTIGLEWARAHGPRPIGGPTRFRSFDLFIFQLRFVYWSGIDNNPAMLKE